MHYLLLSIKLEDMSYIHTLDNKSKNFKIIHKLKHRLFLLFKYHTHSVITLLSFIITAIFTSFPYTLALFIFPLLNTSILQYITIYLLAAFFNQPLILLLILIPLPFPHVSNIKMPAFMKLGMVLFLLPQFTQETFILLAFLLISDLTLEFTQSKRSLNIHKSYYMLTRLSNRKNFLNPKLYNSVIQYLLILSMLSFYIQIELFILVVLIFFYLLSFEIDILIHHHFFNQSKLYSDKFSKMTFTLFIYNGISFLFLIHHKNIYFILWYLLWIIIFNFRSKLLTFSLVFLTACATQTETFTIEDNNPTYIGNMIPEQTKVIEINFNLPYTLHIKNETITQNTPIITYERLDHIEEIQRIDYKINNFNLSKQEIKQLEFDKSLLPTKETIYAPFDGLASIQDHQITLSTHQQVLSLTLSEHEYINFKAHTKFSIYTLNNVHITDIETHSLSHTGTNEYKIEFEAFDYDAYPHETLIIKPHSQTFSIPNAYIIEIQEAPYVMIKGEFKPIKIESIDKETTTISDGVKAGDILEYPFD